MPRNYSDKFLLSLYQEGNEGLGYDLAKLCVKANLPAVYVAKALQVSRMTVYAWFRGSKIRYKNRKVVEAFVKLVSEDVEKGVLPAKNFAASKAYIEGMIGMTI